MKSTMKKVAVDHLVIPTEVGVQRIEGTEQRRIDKMVANFRPGSLGTIHVSERAAGVLAVIDGAHRVAACKTKGYAGHLNAIVYTGLTIPEEAALFNDLNSGKTPSALSRFHSRVAAGDPIARSIADIAAAHQWRITPEDEPGCLAAIDALERVYRNGGGVVPDGEHPALTDRVLSLLTVAWERDTVSVHGHLLLGVAQLVGRCGPSLDDKKLITEMQATRPGVLVGRAKTLRDIQGGTVPAALAKILVSMHNNKRRTNLLPEWVWVR